VNADRHARVRVPEQRHGALRIDAANGEHLVGVARRE
jgi:hypothetical protein